MADYQNFVTVSEQYTDDAGFVNSTMSDIDLSIDELNNTMLIITESINQINIAISETYRGVNIVASNNADTANLTAETNRMAEATLAESDKLNKMVNNFTL